MSARPGGVAAIAVWIALVAAPAWAGERAWDVGVAASWTDYSHPSERSVVRLEAGSLLLEYPGPAIAKDGLRF